MNQIDQKITGFAVKSNNVPVPAEQELIPIGLTENTVRPDVITGKTYKIKPPTGAAVYITINDIELPFADANGKSKFPYEIFIASKDVEHQAWMSAMTRVISAVFRKGGEVQFLVEELKAIHDPKGGYFAKGHGYVPSLIAHIGIVLETHLSVSHKRES